MKVVVVGGGVAGPTLGLALLRAGHEAVVLERRPSAAAQEGSYLTVGPNGLDALAAVDALDLVRPHGFPSRANAMYGATGRHLGDLTLGVALPDGIQALTLKRSALAVVLGQEAERRGVEVRRGVDVVAVEPGIAVLADGDLVTGDLLVGADGVHSLVRRAIDAAAPTARYVGLTNFGGVTRATPWAARLRPEAWHFVFGHRSFFGAQPTPEGDVVWFLNVPRQEISREERAATDEEQWQAHLLDLVSDDAGPAPELVRHGMLELTGDNTYDLPHVPTWWRERMVIIGDAAHAPSPSSGQGASMALEDAVLLARSLRDQEELPRALSAYEAARRRRVEKIVAAGARSSSTKIPGPMGRLVQEAIMRMLFRYVVTDRSTAWMYGHRIRWDEPVS